MYDVVNSFLIRVVQPPGSLQDKELQRLTRSTPHAVSLLFTREVACCVVKPSCKRALTFQLRTKNFLTPPQCGEFVIHCHLLSQDIISTEIIMEKGTVS
jgi:hypothetical protein